MTKQLPRTLLMTLTFTATAVLALGPAATAAPRMTRFDPSTDGFRFVNSFKNDFVRELSRWPGPPSQVAWAATTGTSTW